MKDYTIYITEEIARKAMEKGFECINIHKSETSIEANELYYPDEEFIVKEENSYVVYKLPTAEQICGWLEDTFHILPISILCYLGDTICWTPQIVRTLFDGKDEFKSVNDDLDKFDFQTRQEALLKGIEKALDLI